MTDPAPDHDQHRLTPSDAEAIDALFDAQHDLDGVPDEHRPRAERLAGLLGLLALDPPADEAVPERLPELTPDSASALDAIVLEDFRAARVTRGVREQARVHESLRDAVCTLDAETEAWIAENRDARIARAMDAIEEAQTAEPIPFVSAGRGRFRLADLGGIAAIILLGFAIFSPLMSTLRQNQLQTACLANLGGLASAFDTYAGDNDDALPMNAGGFAGSWVRVGTPGQSNSANLFVLVRSNYAPLEILACPGNEDAVVDPDQVLAQDWRSLENVSYSYRLMWGSAPRRWRMPGGGVLMADRSPIVYASLRGEKVSPEANSPNHDGEGQHMLRLDGSFDWTTTPVTASGDNVWLPRQTEEAVRAERIRRGLITGSEAELPRSVHDVFLGP
ncbi:MAG: hypothetical protein AAGI17_03245 [Planctomycetota bacterium]